MTRFDGAVALVTGAANGIGATVARTLAAQGARVAVADIDSVGTRQVVKDIVNDEGAAVGVTLDVADESAWRQAVADVEQHFGAISLLHSNAALTSRDALGYGVAIPDLPIDLWNTVMAVNAGGCLLSCKHVIPSMLRAGKGSIVFTSSILGLRGKGDGLAYGASKAAVLSLTRSVATAYGRQNIRCNAVAPGSVATQVMADLDEDRMTALQNHTMLGRIGETSEIAAVVAFLLSDEASYVTGQTLVADGGSTTMYQP
jgi:NAD(P)-dependent dehydrogenase (short-subunit alcohol dehydrogenase family)